MARSLIISLTKTTSSSTYSAVHHRLSLKQSSSRLLSLRTQSNQPDLSDESSSSTNDPLLSKLEDAIHSIIVRRSAPDWLPFLPGYSYWVPPPSSQSYGVAQLVEKLANPGPLNPKQSVTVNSLQGWPSSDYFIKGTLFFFFHHILTPFVEYVC